MPGRRLLAVTAVVLLATACGESRSTTPAAAPAPAATSRAPTPTTIAIASPTAAASLSRRAPATPTAPATRPAVAFTATVSRVTAADLPHSWHSGCPVGPAQLRAVRLRYWGFDGRAHLGTLVVNERGVTAAIVAFRRLFAARFPIRSIRPVDDFGGSDPKSMAADNTSGFNCRYAVAPGPPSWSVHAYGLAIDVNPVENPYLEGGQVRPPNGAAYVDRSPYRPGMATPGGALVTAFAAVGWSWGGRWSQSKDYQHFSANGR